MRKGKIFLLFSFLFLFATSFVDASESTVPQSEQMVPENIKVEATDINNNNMCEDFAVSYTVNNIISGGWHLSGTILDKEANEIYTQQVICEGTYKACAQDYPDIFYFSAPGKHELSIYFNAAQLEKSLRQKIPAKVETKINRKLFNSDGKTEIRTETVSVVIPLHNCLGFEERKEAVASQQSQILTKIKALIEQNKYSEAENQIAWEKTKYSQADFPQLYLYQAIVTEKSGDTFNAALLYKKINHTADYNRLIIWFWASRLFIMVLAGLMVYLLYRSFHISRLFIFQALTGFFGGNLVILFSFPGGCPVEYDLGCLSVVLLPVFFTIGISVIIWLVFTAIHITRYFEYKDMGSALDLIMQNVVVFLKMIVNIFIITFLSLIFSQVSTFIFYTQQILQNLNSKNFLQIMPAYAEIFILTTLPLITILFIPFIIAFLVYMITRKIKKRNDH